MKGVAVSGGGLSAPNTSQLPARYVHNSEIRMFADFGDKDGVWLQTKLRDKFLSQFGNHY
jgi:hypothetical protein